MNRTTNYRPRYAVLFELMPKADVPEFVQLRRLLKDLSKNYALRCVEIRLARTGQLPDLLTRKRGMT